MNVFCVVACITLMQGIAGFGVVTLFNIKLVPRLLVPLCFLMGIAVFSLVPLCMQLLFVPFTFLNTALALLLACVLANVKLKAGINNTKTVFGGWRFKLRLYDLPFLLVITVIVLISVWRCYYLPPTPRDITSGTEVMAEYAVKEKTMINSIFTVDLQRNNNHYKSSFVTGLQIIFKLAGLPFGQVWLSVIFISFIVFLYHAVCATLHRIFAGLLIIAFLAVPEMYGYTFMVLFDYSNAVFFFLSFYFLAMYFEDRQTKHLVFAAVLMGVATYIRSETLLLALLTTPALVLSTIKSGKNLAAGVKGILLFLLPSGFIYLFFMNVFINHYMPAQYHVGTLVRQHLYDVRPLLMIFWQVNSQRIFSNDGVGLYGWFIFLFCALFLAELMFVRKFTLGARNFLFGVLVIYLGLPIIGFILPIFDVENTTKRGLFKIFPLMLLYIANNSLLTGISRRLTAWEDK